jgi:hypothetical protein
MITHIPVVYSLEVLQEHPRGHLNDSREAIATKPNAQVCGIIYRLMRLSTHGHTGLCLFSGTAVVSKMRGGTASSASACH